MTQIAYRVRAGFVFTDTAGARPRTYAAGERVSLPSAVGDRAHQLERDEGAAVGAAAAPSFSRKRARAQASA